MIGLPLSFWFENAHFVIAMLAALGLFTGGWLNVDSYPDTPDKKLAIRAAGFFFLTLWALATATGFKIEWFNLLTIGLEFLGIGLLVLGYYIEPVPVLPKHAIAIPAILKNPLLVKTPIALWLALLVRVWLFATVGLIKDLRGLRNALIFILAARILSITEFFRASANVTVFNLTREFSYLWVVENLLLLVGAIILFKWASYFIRFRPVPQLFITLVTTAMFIFVVSTVTFTGFLFNASQRNSIESLERSAAVFEFSLSELKRQTNLATFSLAQRGPIIEAAAANSVEQAQAALGDPLEELSVGGAVITNRSGEVLAVVGSDLKVGESVIADPTVFRALQGKPTQSIISRKLVDTTQLNIRGAFPVVKDGKAIGVTIADFPIDQAFVDNVRSVTKLDVSINAGTVHSATTLVDKNQRRITGTEITNQNVIELTRREKEPWTWSGQERLVDQLYLTVYRSVANADNVNIGSILVGQNNIEIVAQIDRSIKLTFLSTVILILLSLTPLYLVARSIAKAFS